MGKGYREMDEREVVALMKSSKSEAEWDANCDKVKQALGGYPSWWFAAIMLSGVYEETMETWAG